MTAPPTSDPLPMAATDLRAIPYPPEFGEGARNAVTTCLRIQPDEHVTLITDEATLLIAASLAAELDKLGCSWNAFVLEELAPRPLVGMPSAVLADMEKGQVSIFAVQVQPRELSSRMEMTDVVNRRRMRHAHMVNITPEIMVQGSAARRGRRLTACSWAMASWATSFARAMVYLRDTPLTINISRNRISTVECANKQLEREFWEYTHTDVNSDRVGEFAIGTNIGVHEVIGNILQDEKFPGIHIAFGDPYGAHTGAPWKSTTHIDVVGLGFNIWLGSADGEEQLMREGRFLIQG